MFKNWNIKDKLIEERRKLATSYDPVKIAKAIYIEQEYEDHRIQKALNSFGNDFHDVDNIHKDFAALKNLDEFVQYNCVQQLKKLTISLKQQLE